MKRILFIVLCCMIPMCGAWAQMSDAQIVSYVKTQTASGKDQTQIAQELLAKGVSKEQLLRIKTNYGAGTTSSRTVRTVENYDRMRIPNGQDRIVTDKKPASTKKIFGHDIFRSDNLSFQPSMNIPAPATYLLGPGDEVLLDIYGSSQESVKLVVAPDGSISIPEEQPVYVSGLTLDQAKAKVCSTIGMNYEGSTIKLSLGQTRTVLVNVMGEVVTPGTYSLSAFSTVFNALYLAGGVNDIGTMRSIKVSRKGKVVTEIDVYDFILNGRLPGNITLQDDDVIIVGAYSRLVKIEGHIKRPMYYEMKPDESLQSLLTYAGGFTGDAYKEKVRVERRSSEGLTVHNVAEGSFDSFRNEDEDVVVVAPIIERYKNMAQVSGAVFRPGKYKLDGNICTVKSLVEQAGGLLEQAVTSRAVLLRLKDDRTRTTLTIELDAVLNGRQPDVPLQNEDELVIASYSRLVGERKMSVWGEVMNPGTFDYSDNTTIGDLITMAGGLREAATTERVEVSRRITTADDNADGIQMAKVFTFDLDENLQVVGDENFRLEPFDQVTIHRSPNYKVQKSVFIGGEVMYEGYYTITSKDERLSSLIKRAGGLTPKAFVGGTKLVRKYTDEELRNRRLLIQTAQNEADSIAAYQNMSQTEYTVGIDLAAAIDGADEEDDIILKEGDVVMVPQMSNVVKVSGEVLSPNTVTFKHGKRARYYVNQAGGITESGRKRKAYILYANGQISTLRRGKIQPGCEIVVPSKKEKKIDSSKVGMWATLASTTATIAAVVATILK